MGLVQSVTAATGSPSVFVPITPCRLVDTRTGDIHVGARTTPIGANEAVTLAVWGANGNCTIPSTATGIATNTTAVNPTAGSFLTVYPADASPRPTASNLNFVAGSPPTPNQVTVGLSAAGAIAVYNLTGTVDVIVDIVGYYQRAGGASGNGSLLVEAAGFRPNNYMTTYNITNFSVAPIMDNVCFLKSINLPNGATVTNLGAALYDVSTTQAATLELRATAFGGNSVTMAAISTGTTPNPGLVSTGNNLISQPTVDTAAKAYSLSFCGGTFTEFRSAFVDYTLP
ncbi:MAG: hypothetical protein ABI949_08150 [Ilumatobacteraceae bacterium]